MPVPEVRPAVALSAAAVLLLVITWIDYATGYELGLFVFYFAPVALGAWYGGRLAGLALAFASALCWYLSDRLANHPYSNAYFIYWETLMRLVSFVTTALTLSAIRRAVRIREDLLHLVSHDLRLPLGALVGQARLLRKHGGDAAFVAARADAILRAAGSLEGMIDDLLDGARWESRQLRLDLAPLDLATWLPDLVERVGEVLEVQRLDLALPEGPVLVRGDPARIERVVLNLLGNALKYSPPEGRVRLEVAAGEGRVTLAVSDQGPGIAREDLPHLFERFYRGRSGSGREGLGLGLYSAQLLVRAHGGQLRVESAPGAGARFLVELPGGQVP